MSDLRDIAFIEDLNLQGKRVFIRLDLNVPIKDGTITNETRIQGALPTIRYAMDQKAKITLASHLGRPKSPEDKQFSLEPVAKRLSELLGVEVLLFEDLMGDGLKGMASNLSDDQILLLENTRFAKGETKNSQELASHLATAFDVYINDAFGAIHRAHATVDALPRLIPQRGMGYLIQKELKTLDKLLHQADKPFAAILGGIKVSDKIAVIENLMERVDTFVIGGAMAYTFLAAQDIATGSSLIERDKINMAKELLERFRVRNKTLVLPKDHVVAKELTKNAPNETTPTAAIPEEWMGLDIGPKTTAAINEALGPAKTIFWNGPMGAFETPPFEKGTFEVAKTLSQSSAFKVVGGGDSVTAVANAGLTDSMDHISTGGGASLEYLEGKKLPGIEALRTDG